MKLLLSALAIIAVCLTLAFALPHSDAAASDQPCPTGDCATEGAPCPSSVICCDGLICKSSSGSDPVCSKN